MGEFDNETQTSDRHEAIYYAIGDLGDGMVWRLKNFLLIRLLQAIPLGEAMFGSFFPILQKGSSKCVNFCQKIILQKRAHSPSETNISITLYAVRKTKLKTAKTRQIWQHCL